MPLRISQVQGKERRHIYLLLLRNDDGDTHYTWIKNMSHLLHGCVEYKTHRKSYTCPRCLIKYNTEDKFQTQKKLCASLDKVHRVKYPIGKNNEIKKISFNHYKIWFFKSCGGC